MPQISSNSFVQVPPQSSGKRVATELRTELYIDSITSPEVLVSGSQLIGETSGASGFVTGFEIYSNGEDSGVVYLRNTQGTYQNNENLQVNNVTVAQVDLTTSSTVDYDIQKVVITDPDNLTYNQRIDRFGATVNTFTDGSPVFGPFGTLSVGEPVAIKEYTFGYGPDPTNFWDQTSGGGSVNWLSGSAAMQFVTGNTNGDRASRTTNYYHPYSPGTGALVEQTVQIGDNGKNNVVRRWGYYDDNDGFYWELDGDQLSVVVRSSTTGTVTENRIFQGHWNRDRLDGSNSINFDLKLSASNIYWIDFQWLGSGRVRFGVIEPGGERLLAHVVEHANTSEVYPYTRTASLPLRWEQFNTGTAISSSEMKVACAVVKSASKTLKEGVRNTVDVGLQSIELSDGEIIIGSMRPELTFAGRTNRTLMRVKSMTLLNTASDAFVRFRIYATNSLALLAAGATFDPVPGDSSFEISRDKLPALPAGQALPRLSYMQGPARAEFYQLIANELEPGIELFLGADGTTQPAFFVTAEVVSGTATDVSVTVNWEETRR